MEKRGTSHIEIILSFLIFITAIGFALYFFNPGNPSRLVETSSEYIFREIEKNTSTTIQTYSVKINNDTIAESEPRGGEKGKKEREENEQHKKIIRIAISDIPDTMNSFAQTRNGTDLKSEANKENGQINFIDIKSPFESDDSTGWTEVDFIYIYFGNEFVEEQVSGEGVLNNRDFYKIGSSYSEDVVSWNLTENLARSYNDDYFKLKEQFNIPGRVNFGFVLELDAETNITAKRKIPEGLEVFSKQKRVKTIKNGKIIYSDLKINIW